MGSSEANALTVAVLAGGRSSEHEVSLSSGASVREGLIASGHEVVWVEVGRDGVWRHHGERLEMSPGEGLLGVDVVFPVLHGPFGEDGTVQGFLETLDVAYVGAGVAASAVCLDKVLFKELMSAAGTVPQVDYVGVQLDRWRRDPDRVLTELARLGLAAFVKPARLGSSLGIVRVTTAELLPGALEGAFARDPRAIASTIARGSCAKAPSSAPGNSSAAVTLTIPSEEPSRAGLTNAGSPSRPRSVSTRSGSRRQRSRCTPT